MRLWSLVLSCILWPNTRLGFHPLERPPNNLCLSRSKTMPCDLFCCFLVLKSPKVFKGPLTRVPCSPLLQNKEKKKKNPANSFNFSFFSFSFYAEHCIYKLQLWVLLAFAIRPSSYKFIFIRLWYLDLYRTWVTAWNKIYWINATYPSCEKAPEKYEAAPFQMKGQSTWLSIGTRENTKHASQPCSMPFCISVFSYNPFGYKVKTYLTTEEIEEILQFLPFF